MEGRKCCCGMVTSALMLLVLNSLPMRPLCHGDAGTQVVPSKPVSSPNWLRGGLGRGRGCRQWKQLQSSQSSDIHVAECSLPGAEQLLCLLLLSFLHRLCTRFAPCLCFLFPPLLGSPVISSSVPSCYPFSHLVHLKPPLNGPRWQWHLVCLCAHPLGCLFSALPLQTLSFPGKCHLMLSACAVLAQ